MATTVETQYTPQIGPLMTSSKRRQMSGIAAMTTAAAISEQLLHA
jgi:hypothetical protein